MHRALGFLVLVLWPLHGLAAPPFAGLKPLGAGVVESVVDGDTVVLRDGRQVRLVGIQAPKLALGRAGFVDWPLAALAQDHMEALALGQAVDLYSAGMAEDRHGRVLAHVVTDSGVWLQGAMLEAGLARMYTFADSRLGAAALRQAEDVARAERRGVWDLPFYAVREATALRVPEDDHTFVVMQGTVLEAAQAGRTVYLNFGAVWRTDTTITMPAKALPLFQGVGLDPLRLAGKRIEARGWLVEKDGPMLRIDHPEALRVLDATSP